MLPAEGGEQDDAVMPALFALAMRQALVSLQPELCPEERSLAFLTCTLQRSLIAYNHCHTKNPGVELPFFALAPHGALVATQRQKHPGERLLAFMDDFYGSACILSQ